MMRKGLAIVTLLLATAGSDMNSFDRAVDALERGNGAAQGRKMATLRDAALTLRRTGSRPIGGDEDIAATWLRQSHAVEPQPERERILGPGYRALGIAGGEHVSFEQIFLAGQRARVAVVPGPQSDFAMRLLDEGKQTICVASNQHARCDWVPSYTTRVTIELHNPGRQAGRYFIVVQ